MTTLSKEDRKEFLRWRLAPGPRGRKYWYFNELNGVLTLEFQKKGIRMRFDIPWPDIACARHGWRPLVARAVWVIRRALAEKARHGS